MATIQRSATTTAGFIPTIWAQRALDVLRAQLVLPQLVSRDVDFTDSFKVGQTLNIPYPGTFTAQDKVEGTPVTPQTPSGGATVALTLNKHKVVGFSVEDFTEAQADVDLMDTYLNPAIIAIAEKFEQDAWMTLATAGTIAPTGAAGTDMTAATFRTIMRRMNEAKAPAANRSVVLSPKDQAAVLGDSNLANLLAFSQPQAVYNGFMGKLYGLDILWSQLAPTTAWTVSGSAGSTFTYGGQTTGSLTVSTTTAAALQTALAGLSSVGAGMVSVAGPTGGPFVVVFDSTLTGALTASTATPTAATLNGAFHKQAMIYAVRQFKAIAPQAGVQSAQVNDPESGLSIRVSSQYDINAISQRCNVDILYGMVALRSAFNIPTVA
jgi:hypothetical protein